MAYKDLREFIAKLEERNELKRIRKEVDWNLEIGTITRIVFDERGPALLFEKVKDSPYPLVTGVMDTFKRYALGIGSSPDLRSIYRKVMDACQDPLKPILLDKGPCKENILMGDDIDLYKFPTPKWHYLDGGRYMGTLGVVIAKDPVTGIRNIGIYRQQILGKRKTGILTNQQLGVMFERYRDMGKPMPVVTAIGLAPEILAASVVSLIYGQDELGLAGALRGEPVELVKAETVDLEVPAYAEIILEGEIPVDETKWEEEGPFGEFTGYYGGLRMKRPVIELKAITHRNNLIFQGTLEGPPPSESTTLRTIGHTIGVWNKLIGAGILGIKEVYLTDMGCANFIAFVSMDRHYYGGNARQVIEAVWATSINCKWVIIVDDDIDVYNKEAVEWAMATRVQPYRDIVITDNREPGISLDPSIHPDEREYPLTRSSRIGIDATTKFKGYEFPPLARPRPEEMEEVKERWKEYGI